MNSSFLKHFYLLVKVSLVRTVISSLGPDHGVLKSIEPSLFPFHPDVVAVKFAAPPATENRCPVVGVIPHEVEVLVRLEPLLDGRNFSSIESTVQVPRDVGVNLHGRIDWSCRKVVAYIGTTHLLSSIS